MKGMILILAAMLLCTFIACNHQRSDDTAPLIAGQQKNKLDAGESGGLLRAADTAAPLQNNILKPATSRKKSQPNEDWDKKIIKTGELSVEVKDYTAFNDILHTTVKRYGGYIAQEEQQQSAYKIEDIVTIKVPVDQFDEAVAVLTPSTEKIVEKKITADDVTGELLDTKSRMEAKKRVRDRYLDLLKQAKNMVEILQVQNEVNSIQENIEAAAGRTGYLDHAAAFSTIHIGFYQLLAVPGSNDPQPSYGHRIIESLASGAHWLAELLVLMASFWPVLIIVAGAWYFIYKRKTNAAGKIKPVA